MKDVIVIGAGTAGMTAALYTLRAGKSVLVLEKETFGGQISFSPRVENFPSIKQIAGSEFSDRLLEQITDLGAEVELENVLSVEKNGKGFTVHGEYATYEAKSVILALGVKHKHFNLPKEEELVGKGISYCAVCDGAFYAGEEVVLIGDGNTALQYSILLSNYCKKVTVCILFDHFFGDASLVKVLESRENVEIIKNVGLCEFLGEDELTGLVFADMKDKTKKFTINTRAVFVAIGQVPDNKAFENLVELDKYGFIVAAEDCRTSTEGVFVAGDCRTKAVRQLTTAVADGASAAVAACSYVDGNF